VSGSADDHEHDSGANDDERDLSQRRRRSFAPARTLEQEDDLDGLFPPTAASPGADPAPTGFIRPDRCDSGRQS
jgi:hypothetical protein